MAEIGPFRGVRFAGGQPTDLSRLVTAPYDVISQQAQTEYYARDQFNAIRLELGRQSTSDGDEDNRYTPRPPLLTGNGVLSAPCKRTRSRRCTLRGNLSR